jgi:hypothetical protein
LKVFAEAGSAFEKRRVEKYSIRVLADLEGNDEEWNYPLVDS